MQQLHSFLILFTAFTFAKPELDDEEIVSMNINHIKLGIGYRF